MFGGSSSPFILTSWARGSGGGGGAGFGFATGAIVAGSIGNTPANGFTLSDGGSADTAIFSPLTLTMSTPNNGNGFISLDNSGTLGPGGIISGNGTDFASSTLRVVIDSGQVSTVNTVTGAQGVLSPGEAQISDTAGNAGTLGTPNGAGLTLSGAGGTSITEDGTVPSTTWNNGAGSTAVVAIGSFQLIDTSAATATISTGAASGELQLTDGTGATATLTAASGGITFNLSDVAGDSLNLNLTGGTAQFQISNAAGNSTQINGAVVSLSSSGGNSIVANATVPSISLNGPTWTSGTGVPSGTPAIGSFYSRTDGGVGSSFYVYNGSAWLAIA